MAPFSFHGMVVFSLVTNVGENALVNHCEMVMVEWYLLYVHVATSAVGVIFIACCCVKWVCSYFIIVTLERLM